MWACGVSNFKSLCVCGVRSFATKRSYVWKHADYQRQFLRRMFEENQYDMPKDWRKISTYKLRKFGGRQLLYHYPNTKVAFCTLFPEWKDSIETDAIRVYPREFWDDKANHRLFLDRLRSDMQLDTVESLVTVPLYKIRDAGGAIMLKQYENYLALLKEVYPSNTWPEFRHPLPYGFWKSKYSQKQYLDWIGKVLELKKLDDWYSVNTKTILSLGGRGLFQVYGSLFEALVSIYPEHQWSALHLRPIPASYFECELLVFS